MTWYPNSYLEKNGTKYGIIASKRMFGGPALLLPPAYHRNTPTPASYESVELSCGFVVECAVHFAAGHSFPEPVLGGYCDAR